MFRNAAWVLGVVHRDVYRDYDHGDCRAPVGSKVGFESAAFHNWPADVEGDAHDIAVDSSTPWQSAPQPNYVIS